MGEKRNHWPLVNCHVTANFYPRKPILSKPAKGFKSEVFPELGQNQTSRKPCEGTRDREEKKSRAAKLTHTPTEPDDQWEIVPTLFMKNGCSSSTVKLTMGPRADREVSPVYNSTRMENLDSRGKQ